MHDLSWHTAGGRYSLMYSSLRGINEMGLLRWLTKNWANTTEPTHTDLAPLLLKGCDQAGAIQKIEAAIQGRRNWAVVSMDLSAGLMHLTRKTNVIRYVDDIRLTIRPTVDGVAVHAESRSRVGKGDLGQNRRNILELWYAIQSR